MIKERYDEHAIGDKIFYNKEEKKQYKQKQAEAALSTKDTPDKDTSEKE